MGKFCFYGYEQGFYGLLTKYYYMKKYIGPSLVKDLNKEIEMLYFEKYLSSGTAVECPTLGALGNEGDDVPPIETTSLEEVVVCNCSCPGDLCICQEELN